MRIKKMISTIAAFVMIISMCACGGTDTAGSNTSDKSLYEQGLDVISLMAEAASAEEYVAAYTGNPEIMEIIQNIGAGDYTTPTAVYSISVSDEVLLGMLGLENLNSISAEFSSVTEDMIYIYTFENALPAAVSFTVGENGSVSAGGNFIMYEEFTCGSVAEVQEFFSEFGAEVTEVEIIN